MIIVAIEEFFQENINYRDIINVGDDNMKYLGSKTIETDRLILKVPTINEQKYLWDVLMNKSVGQYYLSGSPNPNILDWEKWFDFIKEDIKRANNNDVFRWSVFLKSNNQCIGKVGCHKASQEFDNINSDSIRGVGWYIDPKYSGNGYGFEAASAMIKYMFEECDIDQIIAKIVVENIASRRILEYYGATKSDKTYAEKYMFSEKTLSVYLYSLTKDIYFYNKNKKVLK